MALRLGRSRLPILFKATGTIQQELADYLGVTQPYISQVANNKDVFTLEMAANAAQFFNCTIEELQDFIYVPDTPRRKRP